MRLGIRALLHAARKPSPNPPAKKAEGGGAPTGAFHPLAAPAGAAASLALTGPVRLSALHRGSRQRLAPTGSAPGHASWDSDLRVIRKSENRFSEKITRQLKPACGPYPLLLSQSRDCTSRTGRSTGMTDAQSRPGAVRNAARGNRPRSIFESTLAKGPSVNEMGGDVTISVTNVKVLSLKERHRKASVCAQTPESAAIAR
jgi:hypothetical protein